MSGIATAVIGGQIISSYLGNQAQKKAMDKATEAQLQASGQATGAQLEATKLSIEEQRRQFDEIQAMLAPFISAGASSLTEQLGLLGLGGENVQRDALRNIAESALFKEMSRVGEEALLQQASATGGLRGGGVQSALLQQRPALLNQLFQQRLGNLGSLTGLGQSTAGQLGGFGQSAASSISNLLTSSGQSQAAQALSRGNILGQQALGAGKLDAQLYGDIANILGIIGTKKGVF